MQWARIGVRDVSIVAWSPAFFRDPGSTFTVSKLVVIRGRLWQHIVDSWGWVVVDASRPRSTAAAAGRRQANAAAAGHAKVTCSKIVNLPKWWCTRCILFFWRFSVPGT
jgi:hypothetical protein